MSRSYRLAIIQPEMAPYRFACFTALAEREDIDLLVLYLERGKRPYDWPRDEKDARFEKEVFRSQRRFGIHGIPLAMIRRLFRFRPDVTLLGGWDEPTYYAVQALKRTLGTRIVLWAESTAEDSRSTNGIRRTLKKHLLNRADAVLVPGSAAREYCDSIQPGVNRCFMAPNAIDNERFETGIRGLNSSFDLSPPVFLYVGRLDPEKGVQTLVRAWGKVEGEVGGCLVIAGSGSEEMLLKRMASEMRLSRIHFVGFVPQWELPDWYASADAFVFPSLSDPWGLVINEAMAAGLPIITTGAPGAARDLVVNADNGRVVVPRDERALAEALLELADDGNRRASMGRRSREVIAAHSPSAWAEGVAEMARSLA